MTRHRNVTAARQTHNRRSRELYRLRRKARNAAEKAKLGLASCSEAINGHASAGAPAESSSPAPTPAKPPSNPMGQ